MDKAKIDFAEINKYGAVAVYGSEGIKHYYGYTISEAKRLYREDTRIIKNHGRRRKRNLTGRKRQKEGEKE